MHGLGYRGFVELVGFAALDGQRAFRAFADARAESVAATILDQPRFAVDKGQRAFCASGDAFAASVTKILVNPDNVSYGHNCSSSFFGVPA